MAVFNARYYEQKLRMITSSSKFVLTKQVLALLQPEGFEEVRKQDCAMTNEVIRFESQKFGCKHVEFYKNNGVYSA